jgi:hypothetical protein
VPRIGELRLQLAAVARLALIVRRVATSSSFWSRALATRSRSISSSARFSAACRRSSASASLARSFSSSPEKSARACASARSRGVFVVQPGDLRFERATRSLACGLCQVDGEAAVE